VSSWCLKPPMFRSRLISSAWFRAHSILQGIFVVLFAFFNVLRRQLYIPWQYLACVASKRLERSPATPSLGPVCSPCIHSCVPRDIVLQPCLSKRHCIGRTWPFSYVSVSRVGGGSVHHCQFGRSNFRQTRVYPFQTRPCCARLYFWWEGYVLKHTRTHSH
jgi:hypothetical protein